MKVADFDYSLPARLIADRPPEERSNSRLLVLHRDGSIEHKRFSDLPCYLGPGDMMILNNTKVFPARLTGFKRNGGKIEILLVRKTGDEIWDVISRGGYTGRVSFSGDFGAEILCGKTARFEFKGDFMENVWRHGSMPLPPYIKRKPDESDKERYQTMFARHLGSIAAPTAGLHFTDDLLHDIASSGVALREITLHVGIGTFKPIRSDTLQEHTMDAEYFEMDAGLLTEIVETKSSGRRVICVGTTTTRALEGYADGRCSISSRNCRLSGMTDIFIYPGYTFKAVDSLVTNFHLPRSTPLMLASAKCGRHFLLKAYGEAVAREYRFLSYGDAMLIL
ncbi:MAG: tRNA preQ1(34) S-adenosylmethionine ribosyltransferase-isomerase QueA [Nitrospirota bacterium]